MSKSPRIRDVARLAGVSTATVSYVINESRNVSADVHRRVLAAIAELQYSPSAIARSLKTRSTRTIGVVVSDISNPYFTAVVRGVEDVASANDYTIIICNTDEDREKEQRYLKVLLAKRVDGLIIAPSGHSSSLLPMMQVAGIPIVLMDRSVDGMNLPIIRVDNRGGAYQAVTHLIDDGHVRIGAISGLAQVSTTEERYVGYVRALSERGLAVRQDWVKAGYSKREGGQRAMQELLVLADRPTAVFTTNNLMTLGALTALLEAGLSCPDDMAIVGFDDHEWASIVAPRLTVVRQPTNEVGQKAAELLISLVRSEPDGLLERVLPTELVVRDSCARHDRGRPPAAGRREAERYIAALPRRNAYGSD